MNIATNAVKYTLIILTSGKTMISARSMDDILNHLGGMPRCHAVRTIYSYTKPTFEDAEAVADFPDFDHITAHINLV
jgi:hypothetical protein